MKSIYYRGLASLLMLLPSLTFFGQDDKKIDVDVNLDKGGSDWYQQPWVWIVGGAVFILLLAAILKSSGSKKE